MMIAALPALAALACGAAAGIYLAMRHFLRRPMSAWVALLHGIGGATGFTLVLVTVVQNPSFVPIRNVLYLLVATVVLGCVNLLFHVRRIRHRTSLILLHGFTAVSGAGMLIYAIGVFDPRSSQPPSSPTPPVPSPAPVPMAALEAKPSAPAPATAAEPDARALTRAIRFQTGRRDIDRVGSFALDEFTAVLRAHPEVTLIEVQGHTDRRGDEQRNDDLARARASAAIDALSERGISRSRVRAAAYGSRCPADVACRRADGDATCQSAERWERDRRVDLVVIEVDGRPIERVDGCTNGRGEPSRAATALQARR